jgi:ATP-dependent Zn protease
MRTQTHKLNPNPLRCSAYHEAGHAVVGVLGGLKLEIATIRPTDGSDPQCRWDNDYMETILKSDQKIRSSFTKRFAEMNLASRFSEAMACDMKSDEQQDSHHGDYLDLQRMRRKAGFGYFRLATIPKLKRRARALVKENAAAIAAVAERLLESATLDQIQIESIIKENPPPRR